MAGFPNGIDPNKLNELAKNKLKLRELEKGRRKMEKKLDSKKQGGEGPEEKGGGRGPEGSYKTPPNPPSGTYPPNSPSSPSFDEEKLGEKPKEGKKTLEEKVAGARLPNSQGSGAQNYTGKTSRFGEYFKRLGKYLSPLLIATLFSFTAYFTAYLNNRVKKDERQLENVSSKLDRIQSRLDSLDLKVDEALSKSPEGSGTSTWREDYDKKLQELKSRMDALEVKYEIGKEFKELMERIEKNNGKNKNGKNKPRVTVILK